MPHLQSQSLLIKLQQQLQAADLWSDTPPSPKAMASNAPFACDSMPFEHWLQFIFIPKMTQLIEHKQPLPTNMAIAPMGHHVWQSMPDKKPLIMLLDEFDHLLSTSKQ
ncbi:YqcC family protein [Shewanella gaetbuli]|uniref:YqcC family protein n=1 Tax=Shewanella gaetbuli TaxID=220752 RepID=A0A9X1ZNV8_9GAMM|nr:YqcC family protein [Shewanella gaetbuli]MCL1143325.1 YqcC family protein [Shewanella gaetbuli]